MRRSAAWLCVVAAAVAWFGILLQLRLSLALAVANGGTIAGGLIVFFGYFTVLTNLLVALVLTAPIVARESAAGRFLARPGVRSAAAAAIAMVAIAYHLLLRNVWHPTGWQLVADRVLHYVTPALYLVCWWVAVPKRGLRWRDIAAWSGYPIGYFAYMLVRGHVTGLYPYEFLNAGVIGYGPTLARAAGMLAGFALLSGCLIALGRLHRDGTRCANTSSSTESSPACSSPGSSS